MLSAPFGGHAMNLAALSAALAAGSEAGADRSRRWIAAFTSGLAYLVLALFSAALVTLVSAAPAGPAGGSCGAGADRHPGGFGVVRAGRWRRTGSPHPSRSWLPPRASAFAGIGAAFWALAAGLLVRWLLKDRGTPD